MSLDVNHRPSLPGTAASIGVVRTLAAQAQIVFVGQDELHVLSAETDPAAAAAEIAGTGPTEVVVKRGDAGALAWADGVLHAATAPRVAVVDVIGAGDSFVAGYLAARAEALDPDDRLHWASVCAAFTVGTHGDWVGLPTRAELMSFETGTTTQR